jgi:1-phosphofructokinase family hexose kinase
LQKTLVLPQLLENEVNRSQEYRLDASGKGINVARVLTQLGEQATQLTQAGGRSRDLFVTLAAQDQVSVRWVDSDSEIRSCYTLLSRAAKTCTEIVEEAEPVAPDTEARVHVAYSELLRDHQVVIFSGTKAAGFSAELYPTMVREAKAAGARVILDLRGTDLLRSLEHRPDVIKPNFVEFAATFLIGTMPSEHAADRQLAQRVRERMLVVAHEHGCLVVLTHGTQPTLWTEPGREVVLEAAVDRIAPTNSIGSGDAFTAGLAAALARGAAAAEAVRSGQACGRKNAARLRPGVIR